MNVSCSRTELHEALRIVAGVVDPRNIKPILKDIHVRTEDNCLELSATDLEVGIKYRVRDVEIKEPGDIVVPADPINGIVNESRDERLCLRTEGTNLFIEGRSSKFHLMGVGGEEFPEIPDFPEGGCIEIEGAVLREMIEKTIFAVAVEKHRYALNGVLLATKERSTKVEMVATDGRRLAIIRRKANGAVPFTAAAIIPVKALQQAQKMLVNEDIVKISVQERQILFRSEKGILVAQLVEGRFPAYKEVFPEDCDKKLEIESEEFGNAIRQAAVLSSRDTRTVCLQIKGNQMAIESSSPEAGDARVEMEVKFEGEPIEIRFNPDFLTDGIKAIASDSLRLEMKDPARAAVMRANADYQYLIMPITQE